MCTYVPPTLTRPELGAERSRGIYEIDYGFPTPSSSFHILPPFPRAFFSNCLLSVQSRPRTQTSQQTHPQTRRRDSQGRQDKTTERGRGLSYIGSFVTAESDLLLQPWPSHHTRHCTCRHQCPFPGCCRGCDAFTKLCDLLLGFVHFVCSLEQSKRWVGWGGGQPSIRWVLLLKLCCSWGYDPLPALSASSCCLENFSLGRGGGACGQAAGRW